MSHQSTKRKKPSSSSDTEELSRKKTSKPSWLWVRESTHNYKFDGDCSPPLLSLVKKSDIDFQKKDWIAEACGSHRNTIKQVFRKITLPTWTTDDASSDKAKYLQHLYYCTNAHAFMKLLNQNVNQLLAMLTFEGEDTKDVQALKLYMKSPEPSFARAVFEDFIQVAVRSAKPTSILAKCLAESKELRRELRRVREVGMQLYRKAIWIGLERASAEKLGQIQGKHLVETQEQAKEGIDLQFLTEEVEDGQANYIVLEGKAYRINAPEDGGCYPIVLWTKDGPDDNAPEPKKIFGALVYGLHNFTKSFSEGNVNIVMEKNGAVHCIVNRTNIPRKKRTQSVGKMVKTPGAHNLFGSCQEIMIPPEAEIKHRYDLNELEPFIEARNFEFLMSFLPEFGELCLDVAKNANLVNIFGTPRFANFGTYNYSAQAHLDNDEGPSSGWVMERSTGISRYNKNFVWASHHLIVEMAPGMRWFWLPAKDAHGTTMADFKNCKGDLSKKTISMNARAAQWTTVSAIPSAVSSTYRKTRLHRAL